MTGNELVHDVERGAAAGDHRELGLKAIQIELADHALMALLHEEAPGAGFQFLLDKAEFPLRQAESPPVVFGVRIRIREEHLGGGLLDDRAADGTP